MRHWEGVIKRVVYQQLLTGRSQQGNNKGAHHALSWCLSPALLHYHLWYIPTWRGLDSVILQFICSRPALLCSSRIPDVAFHTHLFSRRLPLPPSCADIRSVVIAAIAPAIASPHRPPTLSFHSQAYHPGRVPPFFLATAGRVPDGLDCILSGARGVLLCNRSFPPIYSMCVTVVDKYHQRRFQDSFTRIPGPHDGGVPRQLMPFLPFASKDTWDLNTTWAPCRLLSLLETPE